MTGPEFGPVAPEAVRAAGSPRTVLSMSDEHLTADDDRPATKDELLAMLEELREMWWQVENERRRVRAGEITRLESLLHEVPQDERPEIEATLAELRAEQAVEPQLPF